MPANRRRHANALPLLSLATWILVAAFVCLAGLGYVYCKNQLHRSGAEIKKLEQEFTRLQTDCEVARTRIASLSSRTELERKRKSGFFKLERIDNERVVRISQPRGPAEGESEVRRVANQSTSR